MGLFDNVFGKKPAQPAEPEAKLTDEDGAPVPCDETPQGQDVDVAVITGRLGNEGADPTTNPPPTSAHAPMMTTKESCAAEATAEAPQQAGDGPADVAAKDAGVADPAQDALAPPEPQAPALRGARDVLCDAARAAGDWALDHARELRAGGAAAAGALLLLAAVRAARRRRRARCAGAASCPAAVEVAGVKASDDAEAEATVDTAGAAARDQEGGEAAAAAGKGAAACKAGAASVMRVEMLEVA